MTVRGREPWMDQMAIHNLTRKEDMGRLTNTLSSFGYGKKSRITIDPSYGGRILSKKPEKNSAKSVHDSKLKLARWKGGEIPSSRRERDTGDVYQDGRMRGSTVKEVMNKTRWNLAKPH